MWTELQAAALDKLGIPRYQLNQTAASRPGAIKEESNLAPETTNSPMPAVSNDVKAETSKPSDHIHNQRQPVLYQLGPWVLQFPHALPVSSYPWLNDLSQFINSRPTQVSAAGAKAIIDCAFVAKKQLQQDEKRALWQQLKPYLTQ